METFESGWSEKAKIRLKLSLKDQIMSETKAF